MAEEVARARRKKRIRELIDKGVLGNNTGEVTLIVKDRGQEE